MFPEDAIIGELYTTRKEVYPYLEQIPEISKMDESVNPCTQSEFSNRMILRNLSCLARQVKTVLVANMGDVQPCKDERQCPSDGHYQFNTNVIFENDGTLIAKYHKQNLYGPEKKYFDAGTSSNCITFPTSFGVTFGTFTCFDLLYNEPGDCLGCKELCLTNSLGEQFSILRVLRCSAKLVTEAFHQFPCCKSALHSHHSLLQFWKRYLFFRKCKVFHKQLQSI